MIRVRFTATTEQLIDFPDDFKIQNGDGIVQVKDPRTNLVIFQSPAACTHILRMDNKPDQIMPPDGPPPAPPDPETPADEAGA